MGHSFYVYGDFPIIFTRYIAEWTNQNTYDTVNVLGRQISASFDLLTILMVFLIGKKLYDRRIGLLASAFYSLAVIPIQLSHFFAVDTFAGFFVSVAIYAAVSVYRQYQDQERSSAEQGDTMPDTWLGIGYYLLFGAALALAMASKVSTAPLAVILPLAVFCWYIRLPVQKQVRWFIPLLRNMLIAAAFAFLLFRVFQPYAFAGPSFFNIRPNPKFVQNLTDLKGQTSGQADFPPALQWARQSKLFAFKNLTLWGTGLPLGILGWIAFLWMAIRMIRGEWSNHLTIWLWTGAYFAWQSISWNPMMRYTYLIYPTFCIMAGWLIIRIWDTRFKGKIRNILPEAVPEDTPQDASIGEDSEQKAKDPLEHHVYRQSAWAKLAAVVLAVIVLAGSAGWAYAFTRIYTRPVTRIAATRWIYQNVPGPVNLHYETIDGPYNQPIAYPYGAFIVNDQPLSYDFNAAQTGKVTSISFFRIGDLGMMEGEKQLTFTITDAATNTRMFTDSITSAFINKQDQRGSEYKIQLETPILLVADHRYNIRFELSKGDGLLTIVGSSPANESDWDDGLPLRMDSYDGFGGIYDGTLNFQMYWEDDEDKRERFITTLDLADYIFISSNRQWGTTTRVPERYPLTTTYYRNLVGCPDTMDTLVCLAQAEPGKYQGKLGFDLIQVFDSYPSLGNFKINDTLSEESFTVYDHPKVFIFQEKCQLRSTDR